MLNNLQNLRVIHLMSLEQIVCEFDFKNYTATIHNNHLMPPTLYFNENTNDIDDLIENGSSIIQWLATRVLPLDRTYAKEILNTLGFSQNQSDKTKASISLTYRALSLQDTYWIKESDESVSWSDINLFTNPLSNVLTPVALLGKSITLTNHMITSPDLSTQGTYAKAWVREGDDLYLYKGDSTSDRSIECEVLTSNILDCFDIPHITYEKTFYENKLVCKCKCMTNEQYSIVDAESFMIWCENHDKDFYHEILRIDSFGYYSMNIIDYLIGNSDRHLSNWGLYRDNYNGSFTKLHPLFDHNRAFDRSALANEDGGNCLPESLHQKCSQKDAALSAMKHITLTQTKPIMRELFFESDLYDIFMHRANDVLHLNIQ
ncbi:HipA family kinase [Anaerosporobacter sp.]|uniref:HipA family kinase n=1 Tax=Anaerosporobacter sp. TaxID=1872529 RepID=UPI00286FAEBC|nr:HipA family kinase [Anaerosporobacter sp.]